MDTVRVQYEAFHARRAALAGVIEHQRLVAAELAMSAWHTELGRLAARVRDDRFKVLVLGEFKRGKSTLINALLGEEVLPAYARPCTAIINEVKWGEPPRAMLHHGAAADGTVPQPRQIPVDQIEQYVVIRDDQALRDSPYERVELFWPLELCRNGVEIIDSPGLNENTIRQKVTTNYLSQVDAVLFVFSCEALASASELDFIDNILRVAGHEDIFFICNRYNMIRAREKQSIREYAHGRLASRTRRGTERVFFISALDALEGRLEGDQERVVASGVARLEEELARFLAQERGQAKLLRPAIELRRAIQEGRRLLPERRSLLQTDLATLEERYRQAQEPLKRLELQRQQILTRLDRYAEEIREAVDTEARNFYRELADRRIPEWVDGYDLQNRIELLKFYQASDQVKRAVEELTTFVQGRLEGEFGEWQRTRLQELVGSRLKSLLADLDTQARQFVSQVDRLRVQLSAGASGSFAVETGETSTLERLLAMAGGLFLGSPGAAAMGALFGVEEMLKSLIPQIAIATVMVMLVGFNPVILIPALLTSAFFQGQAKLDSTNQKLKQSFVEEFTRQMRVGESQQAAEIAEAVAVKVSEIRTAFDEGLGREVQNVRDQVESIRAERLKGEANVQRQLERLTELESQLNAIESELGALVHEIIPI